MNVHKNARTCPRSRELLYKRVSEHAWSVQEASEAAGISALGRDEASLPFGLARGIASHDYLSRPRVPESEREDVGEITRVASAATRG